MKNTNRKKVTTATNKSLARKLGCLRGACKCVADVEKVAGMPNEDWEPDQIKEGTVGGRR